jgi:hypothetical protein
MCGSPRAQSVAKCDFAGRAEIHAGAGKYPGNSGEGARAPSIGPSTGGATARSRCRDMEVAGNSGGGRAPWRQFSANRGLAAGVTPVSCSGCPAGDDALVAAAALESHRMHDRRADIEPSPRRCSSCRLLCCGAAAAQQSGSPASRQALERVLLHADRSMSISAICTCGFQHLRTPMLFPAPGAARAGLQPGRRRCRFERGGSRSCRVRQCDHSRRQG